MACKRQTPGCSCTSCGGGPPCNAALCVFLKECNGTTSLSGSASVRDDLTDAELATITIAGSGGCVTMHAAGVYQVVITVVGRPTIRRTVALACGSTVAITVKMPPPATSRWWISTGCLALPLEGVTYTVLGVPPTMYRGGGVSGVDGRWYFDGPEGTYTVDRTRDRFTPAARETRTVTCNQTGQLAFNQYGLAPDTAAGYDCCQLAGSGCNIPTLYAKTLTTNKGSGELRDIDELIVNGFPGSTGYTHYCCLTITCPAVVAPTPPSCVRPCPEPVSDASIPITVFYNCRSDNSGQPRPGNNGYLEYALSVGGPTRTPRGPGPSPNCNWSGLTPPIRAEAGWYHTSPAGKIDTSNPCIRPLGSTQFLAPNNDWVSSSIDPTSCDPYHAEGGFTSNPFGLTDWSVDE